MTTKKADNDDVKDPVAEEPVSEAPAEEAAEQPEETLGAGKKGKMENTVASVSGSIEEAVKQVEKQMNSISKALGSALQDRANVVMVRVNDDSLHYLDILVEADITKSRSESAAFLINEGIKANEGLFNKISEITDQIAALKAQLRETVKAE
jgi:uncharacterized FlaG/YvyC family protein